MFNDDEHMEAGSTAAFLLTLFVLTCCGNKSQYPKEPVQPKKPTPKIEHIQPIISTNQIPKNLFFYKAQFRQK